MKYHHLILLGIAFLPLITACDVLVFSPEGDNYVEVSPEPKPFTVHWNSISDTLGAWGDFFLDYQLDEIAGHNGIAGLFIMDSLVAEAPIGRSLYFNTLSLPDGFYPMQIAVLGRSGTGSLIDHAGGEFQIVLSDPKHLYIDNGSLGTVGISSFHLNDDGSLRINWEPYDRPRYKGYAIRDFTGCEGKVLHCGQRKVEFIPPDSTSWTDMHYDGANRSYRIVLLDTKYDSSPTFGPERTFSDGFPASQITDSISERSSNMTLKWNPTAYPHSFIEYTILYRDPITKQLVTIDYSIDPLVTESRFPTPLGTDGYFILSILSDNITSNRVLVDSVYVQNGRYFTTSGKPVLSVHYIMETDRYLVLEEGMLMLFDARDMSLMHQQPVLTGDYSDYSLSHDENSFVVSQAGNIQIFSTNDLSIIHDFKITDFVGHHPVPYLQNSIIDSQNRLWFNFPEWPYGTFALNLNTQELIDINLPRQSSHYLTSVSPDGRRFLGLLRSVSGPADNNQYILLEDGTWLLAYNYVTYKTYGFSNDGKAVYMYYNPNNMHYNAKIRARDTVNNAILLDFNMPVVHEDFIINPRYDIVSFWNWQENSYQIFNLKDGSLFNQIPYNHVRDHKFWDLRVEHSIVWTPSGIFQSIDELI